MAAGLALRIRRRESAMIHLRGARLKAVLAVLLMLSPGPADLAMAAAADGPDAAAAEPAGPVMTDARIVGDDSRVRFIADISDTVEAAVFTLADPYRIVVDLPQIRFALPDGVGESGRGLFSAFRYGMISPGKSRIVIDLTGPVKIDKSFVVPKADGQPARLVVDVVPASRKEFLEATLRYRDSQSAQADTKRNQGFVPRPEGSDSREIIVIDPGHGGIDAGATGVAGTLEKNITLTFAKVLGEKLKETGRYDVRYTREDDSFVALGERVSIARSLGASLFVSIHANSFSSKAIRGTVVYTVSDGAADKMAAEIAASENQSDVLAGVELDQEDSDGVRDILFDLTRRETRNFGVVFAQNLVKNLREATTMFKIPHQQAGFKVLEAPDVPSAMIELGYLSNPNDEKQLLSEKWQDKTADSVVKAIGSYFEGRVIRKAEQ